MRERKKVAKKLRVRGAGARRFVVQISEERKTVFDKTALFEEATRIFLRHPFEYKPAAGVPLRPREEMANFLLGQAFRMHGLNREEIAFFTRICSLQRSKKAVSRDINKAIRAFGKRRLQALLPKIREAKVECMEGNINQHNVIFESSDDKNALSHLAKFGGNEAYILLNNFEKRLAEAIREL
ncbi:MAG: hypothetical protein WC634_06230 [archaeon]